jgi:SagB-type dehydrogenase family enzyme
MDASEALGPASVSQRVSLPEPDLQGSMPLEQAISGRRSRRSFSRDALSLEQIGQLLWSAEGITSPEGLRAAPSAGAMYPLEVYLACAQGLFRYVPHDHALMKKSGDDPRAALASAALGQDFITQAAVCVIFTAVYERTTGRYKERGRRYVHMDAGYAAENVHLQAEALGLGSVSVGAFDDDAVARLLGLPRGEEPLLIIPVGRVRGT